MCALDPDGHLWVAAEQGLFRLDDRRLARGSIPEISGANPDLIAMDHQGYLWSAGPSQDLMRLRVSGDRVVEAKHIGRPRVCRNRWSR